MSFKSSFTTPAVVAFSLCLIGGTTPASADLGDQLFKLLPEDGTEGDEFGHAVGISGATAIVGAARNDDNGGNFGAAVTLDNDTIVVGARGDDDNGNASGSAYVFNATGTPGKCPWDVDGTGSVGASDLLSLLVSWGPCSGCPADFDGNGSVGASDLLALLVNWGPCP